MTTARSGDLDYLERSPSVALPRGSLIRLADGDIFFRTRSEGVLAAAAGTTVGSAGSLECGGTFDLQICVSGSG